MPFALKSCECLNFTAVQKTELQAQIAKIEIQIKLLKINLTSNTTGNPYINPECPGGSCPVVDEIKSQIAQL